MIQLGPPTYLQWPRLENEENHTTLANADGLGSGMTVGRGGSGTAWSPTSFTAQPC